MRPPSVLLILEQPCYIQYRTDKFFLQEKNSIVYFKNFVRYNGVVLKHLKLHTISALGVL